ncbi:MAG: DMT family transporter [Methylacidiphilales bacterium]|nr:DMT family transporter [Candidatus Methylacidiphilales bacterium]
MLVTSVLGWSLGTVFSKMALLEGASVLPLFVVQLVTSFIFVVLFVIVFERNGQDHSKRYWWLGLLEPGLAYLVATYGLALTSATNAVVIQSSESFMIVLIVFMVFKSRITIIQLGAGCVLFIGALLVCVPDLSKLLHLDEYGKGDLLILIGTFCAALYVSLTSKIIKGNVMPGRYMMFQLGVALVSLILFVSIVDSPSLFQVIPAINKWSIGSGVLTFGVSFILYLYGMRYTSVATSAFVLCLTPVFGIVFAFSIIGEKFQTLVAYAGFGLVLIGMLTMSYEEKRLEKIS